MKFVLPAIWIGGFAAGTIALFVSPNSLLGPDGGPPGPVTKWIFLCATIVGAVFLWWTSSGLKRVRMDATALYISNYSTEIVVPLTNVAEVTENYWVGGHPVTIRFHSDTEFGSQVTFTPRIHWSGFWASHPAVDEIRLAVSRATGRDQA
jgi:hypothetical protein